MEFPTQIAVSEITVALGKGLTTNLNRSWTEQPVVSLVTVKV